MSTEVAVALGWIESTLSGDATLQSYAPGGVFQTFNLPGTTPPHVIVQYQNDGRDNLVFGGSIAYSDMHFRVVARGPFSTTAAINNAAGRIKTLLTVAAQTSVTGGTITASFPAQPVSEDEWVDSEKWNQTGNVFCVMAKAS